MHSVVDDAAVGTVDTENNCGAIESTTLPGGTEQERCDVQSLPDAVNMSDTGLDCNAGKRMSRELRMQTH